MRVPVALGVVGLLLAAAGAAVVAEAAELARRSFLGLQFDPADASGPGLHVSHVDRGSAAEQAGVRVGDRLTSVGSIGTLESQAALRDELARTAVGARIALRWYRGANTAFRAAPQLGGLPHEQVIRSRVRYDAVRVDGSALRLIVSEPEELPARLVFYLQGTSCDSLDFWQDREHPVKRLIDGWAAEGLATARLEKRGVGDSEGPPCDGLDFDGELRGFRAALSRLTELGFGGRVLLFGHGVGGVVASLLATDAVAAVMVYGAPAQPWYDHVLASLARQDRLAGLSAAEARSRRSLRAAFQRGLLFEGLTPAELLARLPAAAALPDVRTADAGHYLGRPAAYFVQLASHDPERSWRQVWQPVLALYGTVDWTATRADQQRIAGFAGGRFQVLPGLGHDLLRYETAEEAFLAAGTGSVDPAIVEATVTWIRTLRGG